MSKSLSVSLIVGAALGKTFGSTFRSAEGQLNDLGQSVKKLRVGKAITGDIVQLQSKLEGLRQKQKQAAGGGKALAREIQGLEKKLKKATQQARRHGVEIGDAVREHKKFGQALRESERQLGRLERRRARRQQRQHLQGRFLPVAGAAYSAGRLIGGAMNLEEKSIRLRTVINAEDGDTEAALQLAREQARDFARRSLASESEIIDIQYALNSAGLSEAAARVGSEVVSKVATVTSGLPEQVGEIIGTTFNNMGAAIEGSSVEEKMGRIGDVLTKTQLKYQIRDFGQLGESMRYASASAVMNQVSLEQTAAAIGLLNSAGVQGSQGGTAFSAVLRQMGKASQDLGFRIVRDAEGNMDFAATLQEVKTALSVYDDLDERNMAIQRLFGEEGARGLVPLLEDLESYREGLQAMGDATGIVDKNYKLFQESASGQWKMLGQNLVMVGNILDGTLLPTLNTVIKPMVQLAAGAGSLIERFPVLGQAIGGVTIGFGGFVAGAWALRYAGTLVGDAWDAAKDAAQNLGKAIQWTRGRLIAFNATTLITSARTKALAVGGAIKSFGSSLIGLAGRAIPVAVIGLKTLAASMWALVANPVGAIIAGIALGIAAAGMLIYKYWEPIKAFFGGLWQGFMEGLQPLLGALGQLWITLVEAVRPALEPLEPIWSELGGALSWVGDVIGSVVGWFGSLLTPVSAASEQTRGAAQAGLWLGKILGALVVGAIKLVVDAIFGLAQAAWYLGGALIQGIGSAWQSVVGWLEGVSLYDVGVAILTTLGEGILGAGGWLLGQVQSVFGKVRDLLPFSDAKAGPFSALTASGQSILSTLGQGVRQAGPQALQRPLTHALTTATAGLALTLPIAAEAPEIIPASSPTGRAIIQNYYNQVTIHQQPGEDAEALAGRILREIERRDQLRRRGASHDGF